MLTTVLALTLLVPLPQPAQGPASRAPAGPGLDSLPPTRVELHGVVRVPLEHPRPGDPRPMVTVTVDGKGPFHFLVETGANTVGLSRELIDSLRLGRAGGPDDQPEYRVSTIAVGDARFEDLYVAALPPDIRVDGILGLPLWRDVLLTIDYPAGELELERGALPPADGRDILTIRHGMFWELPVTVAGRDTIAILDTQNSGTISLPPTLADSLPFDGGLTVIGRARGAFGEAEIKGGRLAGSMQIGRYMFPEPVVSVVPLPPDYPRQINVGSGLLQAFVVTLDQRQGRLRLAHEGSPVVTLPEPHRRAAPLPAGTPAEGRTSPGAQGAVRLADFVGTYGDRVISIAGDSLLLTRPNGRPNLLIPAGPDAFGVEGFPNGQVEFVRDASGRVASIRVLDAQGVWETAPRAGP